MSEKLDIAIKKIKEFEKVLEEYMEAYRELGDVEKNLMGALVVGLYSPIGNTAPFAQIGNGLVIDGIVRQIVKKASEDNSDLLPEAVFKKMIEKAEKKDD